jgi:hypothetical protein
MRGAYEDLVSDRFLPSVAARRIEGYRESAP